MSEVFQRTSVTFLWRKTCSSRQAQPLNIWCAGSPASLPRPGASAPPDGGEAENHTHSFTAERKILGGEMHSGFWIFIPVRWHTRPDGTDQEGTLVSRGGRGQRLQLIQKKKKKGSQPSTRERRVQTRFAVASRCPENTFSLHFLWLCSHLMLVSDVNK